MKHVLFLLISIYCIDLPAQETKIYWVEQEIGKSLPIQFVKTENGTILSITEQNKSIYLKNVLIKVYDEKFNFLREIEHKEWVSPKWDSKKYILYNAFSENNRVHILLALNEDNKWKLYKNTLSVDFNAGEELVYVGEFANNSSKGFLGMNKVDESQAFFKYIESDDHSKILYYHISNSDKELMIDAICFDRSLNKLYNVNYQAKEISLKNEYLNHSIKLANNGDFYFEYSKKTKQTEESKENKKQIMLCQISDFGKIKFEKEIEQISNYIDLSSEDKLVFSQDQSIINQFTENLSYLKSIPKRNGYNLHSINQNMLEVDNTYENIFNLDLLRKIYSDKKINRTNMLDKDAINHWYPVNTFAMVDNSQILILQYYKSNKLNRSKNGTKESNNISIEFGDILILKFNSDKNLDWSQVFYRKQNCPEASLELMEIMSVKNQNKIFLIYNDNATIEEIKGKNSIKQSNDPSRIGTNWNRNAILREIDMNGNVASKLLLNGKSSDEYLQSSRFKYLHPNSIILAAIKNNKINFGLINFGLQNLTKLTQDSSIEEQPIASIQPQISLKNLETKPVQNEIVELKKAILEKQKIQEKQKTIVKQELPKSTPPKNEIADLFKTIDSPKISPKKEDKKINLGNPYENTYGTSTKPPIPVKTEVKKMDKTKGYQVVLPPTEAPKPIDKVIPIETKSIVSKEEKKQAILAKMEQLKKKKIEEPIVQEILPKHDEVNNELPHNPNVALNFELPKSKNKTTEIKMNTIQKAAPVKESALKNKVKIDNDDDYYSVQILASKRKEDNHPALEGIDFRIVNEKGYYKYIIGKYSSYDEAIVKKLELKQSGRDCFIVHYINGERK